MKRLEKKKSKFETYHVVFVHRKVAVPLNLCIRVLAKHPFSIQLNEFRKKETKKSRKKKQTNRVRLHEKTVVPICFPLINTQWPKCRRQMSFFYVTLYYHRHRHCTRRDCCCCCFCSFIGNDILLVSSLLLNYLIDTFIKWLVIEIDF